MNDVIAAALSFGKKIELTLDGGKAVTGEILPILHPLGTPSGGTHTGFYSVKTAANHYIVDPAQVKYIRLM